ncbi:MAG: hypothetical protein AMJ95_11880 [Omnitrophica WOR_2 bacterium SM23_72]|nr:MAG: hypothetical protein AMJ95_11880 [Omnitrophica WOR_2 bacterium SM23_72]
MRIRVKEFLLRKKEVCLVAGIVVIHFLVNYIWLKLDNFPLWFDFGGYYKRSIDLFYASQKGWVDFVQALQGVGRYYEAYFPYRLILPLFSLPWYYLFGLSTDTAVMSSFLFMAIALFFTYAIASKLFDRPTGVLAAFILSTSPAFFIYYRRFSPDAAIIGLIGLTAYFLLCSDNFQRRGYSVLFGLGLGLSMMTKELSIVFIFGIVIYVLYKIFFYRSFLDARGRKRALINFTIALCLAGVLMFPLYWLHRQRILLSLFGGPFSNAMRQKYGMPAPLSLQGLTYYIYMIFDFGISPFACVFFILGLYLFLKRKIDHKWFLIVWLLSSYVILSSAQTKAWYYGISLLIPIVLITSFGVNTLFRNKKARFLLIVIMVIGGIQSLLVYSFPVFKVLDFFHLKKEYDISNTINEDWKLAEIVDYIRDNLSVAQKDALVYVGADLNALSPMTLDYVAAEKKVSLRFAGSHLIIEDILECDFVVFKSGIELGTFFPLEQARRVKEALMKNRQFIKLQKEFSLPDGSQILIYKNLSL